MLIHVISHTTPQIAPATCYGQADIPLVDTFPQERDVVLSKLLDNYDYLITSPLQRCALLAEAINADQRAVDKRILEYNFGDWELKAWNEITHEESHEWRKDIVNITAPGGESLSLLQARVMDFFEQILQQEHKKIAIVTHSGVQRILHAHILKTPLSDIFNLQLDFGAVIEIKHHEITGALTVRHL